MRRIVFAILLASQGVASASYFEFCVLTGHLASEPVVRDGVHHFSFYVANSVPAKCGVGESYRPEVCASYQGRLLDVILPIVEGRSPKQNAGFDIIQRVWLAETTENPGYRVTWQWPEECHAVEAESRK